MLKRWDFDEDIGDFKMHLLTDNQRGASRAGGWGWPKVRFLQLSAGRDPRAWDPRPLKWGVWKAIAPRTEWLKIWELDGDVHSVIAHLPTDN